MIEQLRGDYSDRLLCEALDVHRSSLYHEPRPERGPAVAGGPERVWRANGRPTAIDA